MQHYNVVSLFNRPVILCIDIPCRHMEGGDEYTVDIIQLLEPVLGAGQIRCLITTSPDEFNEAFSSNDQFFPVLTTQPSIIETVSLIRSIRNNLEATNNFNIHDNAIIAAANLATHFLPEQPLPDCAIDIIDEAAAAARMELHCGTKETVALEKQMRQLEIEISSLHCDGTASTDRLAAVAYLKRHNAGIQIYNHITRQRDHIQKLGGCPLPTGVEALYLPKHACWYCASLLRSDIWLRMFMTLQNSFTESLQAERLSRGREALFGTRWM